MRSAWVGPLIGTCLALAGCGRIGFDGGGSATGDGGPGGGDALDDAPADARPLTGGATGTLTDVDGFGGAGDDDGYDVAVAADGTVYVTGTFAGSLTIGNTVTTAGGDDIFVASFAADGTPRWVRGFGGPGTDRGQGIALDATGAPYVCGLFAGTASFGIQMLTAAGMWDAFVLALDTSGAAQWVRPLGGAGADFAYDVAVAPDGDVLTTGYYEGTVPVETSSLPAFGLRDVYVVRYSKSGVLRWANGYGSVGNDAGQGVAITAAGGAVAVGTMAGTIDLGTGPAGVGGSFVVELDAAGGRLWSKVIDGVIAWDVEVDPVDDRVLVGARISDGVDLFSAGAITTRGQDDALVIAFDAARLPVWWQTIGDSLSDLGLGITVDADGHTYVIGLGGPDLAWDGGSAVGNGGQDVMVMALDPAGAPRWGRLYGGTAQDRGYGIAAAPGGGLWITGRFAGTAMFGTAPLTSVGLNDLFVARID